MNRLGNEGMFVYCKSLGHYYVEVWACVKASFTTTEMGVADGITSILCRNVFYVEEIFLSLINCYASKLYRW